MEQHVKVTCTNCGTKLKAPVNAAGKSAKCPKCGNMVTVYVASGPGNQPPQAQYVYPPPAKKKMKRGNKALIALGIIFVVIIIAALNQDPKNTSQPEHKETPSNQDKGTDETPQILAYRLGKEELYDAPIKTQVLQCIEITADKVEVDKATLEATLKAIYETQSKRTGFKCHYHPSHIFLYAYTTENGAKWGGASWVARLEKMNNDPVKVYFNDYKMDLLKKPSEEKFGLSEDKRMEIYAEIEATYDQSMFEVDKEYPPDIEASLKPGHAIKLQADLNLMPEIAPDDPLEAMKHVKVIPPEFYIHILQRTTHKGTVWYEVFILDDKGKRIGLTGWVNSLALINRTGIDFEEYNDKRDSEIKRVFDQHKKSLAQKHGLVIAEIDSIRKEGCDKEWPMPPMEKEE